MCVCICACCHQSNTYLCARSSFYIPAPTAKELPPSTRELKVGDLVYVPKLKKNASIVKLSNKGKCVDLKVGVLTISAKADEVEFVR